MLVAAKDGTCRECGGQLKVIGADDATMRLHLAQILAKHEQSGIPFEVLLGGTPPNTRRKRGRAWQSTAGQADDAATAPSPRHRSSSCPWPPQSMTSIQNLRPVLLNRHRLLDHVPRLIELRRRAAQRVAPNAGARRPKNSSSNSATPATRSACSGRRSMNSANRLSTHCETCPSSTSRLAPRQFLTSNRTSRISWRDSSSCPRRFWPISRADSPQWISRHRNHHRWRLRQIRRSDRRPPALRPTRRITGALRNMRPVPPLGIAYRSGCFDGRFTRVARFCFCA